MIHNPRIGGQIVRAVTILATDLLIFGGWRPCYKLTIDNHVAEESRQMPTERLLSPWK